ncbi:hypothetical protein C8J32_101918 [Rhizobium sp. PP-CC-3A-592]|nr:hypothetical protein C8J32_101918 [Rhizobium sp. PP-CC-3A-592]
MKSNSKKRHRNCADRMRHDLTGRQRQRTGDPAGKMLLKLLAMISATLAILPSMPSFSFVPKSRCLRLPVGISLRRSRATSRLCDDHEANPQAWFRASETRSLRKAEFNHLDDEDRGPTAFAMERGIDPPFNRTSSRAAPTWSRLVKDLKRPRARKRASELLEYRVPPAAVDWLRSLILIEDWMSLQMLGRNGTSEDEIAAAVLAEAKRWEAAQQKLPDTPPDPGQDGSGEPASGTGLKP